MQTVFRLIEDNRTGRIHYGVGHFGTAMRREAMHEYGVRSRLFHQSVIHLIRGKDFCIASLRIAVPK